MVRTLAGIVPLGFLVSLAPAVVGAARTPEQDVRCAVRAVSRALAGGGPGELAALFTTDAELRIGGHVVATGPDAIADALAERTVWSEISAPRLERISVRLLLPDAAVVDAWRVRYGSVIVKQSTPVLLLVVKHGAVWRVASMRILPGCGPGAAFYIPVYRPALP